MALCDSSENLRPLGTTWTRICMLCWILEIVKMSHFIQFHALRIASHFVLPFSRSLPMMAKVRIISKSLKRRT